MRNISAAVAMVLLGFLVQLLAPQSNVPAESSKKGATAAKTPPPPPPTSPKDPVLDLMCESLGLEPSCDVSRRYETVLVTVPDPVTTRLGIYFDRWIESIQRAAEQSGYTFDSYWLPWRNGADGEKEEKEAREAREKTPGVILFRHENGKRLAFFLVGETPSHGIHRAQMKQFLRYVCDRKVELSGVAGPSFSGSLDSLSRMLQPVVNAQSLPIVSGATTYRDGIKAFRRTFPRFQTTVRDDAEAVEQLKAFLRRGVFGGEPTLVVLSESGTPYGNQFEKGSSIQFPRDISVVRNAYQEDPNLAGGKAAQGSTTTSLQTPLKDALRGSDTTPLFAGAQSAASQEAVLLGIGRQLRAQRANYVAIVATNVLDVMFLAQFLKRSFPDVRLVFLESDILFVRPPDSQYLEGSLTVSTYPLFLPNQLWFTEEGKPRELTPFPSNSTQGVYNAVRVLLGGGKLSEYGQIGSRDGRPPVWISVAGRDNFWPLSAVSPEPQPALHQEKDAPIGVPRPDDMPPNAWMLVFGVTCAGAGTFILRSIKARRHRAPATWYADFALPFGRERTIQPAEEGRGYFQLIVLFCLLSIVLIEAVPVGTLVGRGELGWYLVIGVVALVVFLWLLWEAVTILYHLLRSPRLQTKSFALVVFGCLFLFIGLWCRTIAPNDRNEGTFLILRCLHLDSGVSPTLPMMLAALALLSWGWVHWQRMIFACERNATLPPKPFEELASEAVTIASHLSKPYQLTEPPAIVSLVLAMLAAAFILHSFEYVLLDILYRIVVGWIAGLLAVNFQLYLRLWWRLRAMLERMEQLPMRNAFSTLPADLANASLWSGSPYKRIFLLLTRSAETLELLAAAEPSYIPNLKLTARGLRFHVDRIVGQETQGCRASHDEMTAVRRVLSETASRLSAVLGKKHWQRVLPEKPERPAKPSADELAEEFVVLQYVAFIRYVLLQLRNYLTSFTTGFVLLALSLNSYPFRSAGRIRWMVTAIFLTVGTGVIWSLAEMDRDAILSRLQKTVAGKLDLSFVMKVVTIGIVPLLTALGSQFPEIGRFLTSWVQPAISVLK